MAIRVHTVEQKGDMVEIFVHLDADDAAPWVEKVLWKLTAREVISKPVPGGAPRLVVFQVDRYDAAELYGKLLANEEFDLEECSCRS